MKKRKLLYSILKTETFLGDDAYEWLDYCIKEKQVEEGSVVGLA
ncbi:hypothetical protein ACFPU1_00740 [Thalassorhabdus alkalitolerans]|uniref:Uncharacterized protein n=1 Tax=Thalassorhabdus alkalitolerans TaxID=2282697 RepID=A0ABW0YLS6_9BACI